MTDASGSTTWVYGEARGRLTQETKVIDGSSYPTQWEYYSGDQVTKMTYPGPGLEVVNYTYRPQMGVNSINPTTTYVQQTLYDEAGRVTLRTLGANQLTTWYNYNPWATQGGRLKELRTGGALDYSGTNPSVQFLRYDYDLVGNVNWIQDGKATNQQQNFLYDTLDRLTQANVSGGDGNGNYNESYTYDSAGRLLSGPLGANYTYGDPNHLHAVTSVGSNSYSYDANGNVTSRTVGGNTYTLSYDAENRLTSVSGAATASFVYDGDGARVKGTVNGVTTIYIGNHYEVSGSVARKYYYAGNQRIAMREGTAGHLWLFNDHLGSTGYTYNATTKQGELRYKPFGVTRYTWGTTPTSYRYTGQREEAGLGLYYYGARWYDPALGRFIQPDTIVPNAADAKAFDRYAYVYNNPLKYIDPSGHDVRVAYDAATNQFRVEATIEIYDFHGTMLAADLAATAQDWETAIEDAWNNNVPGGNNFTYGAASVVFDVDVVAVAACAPNAENCVAVIAPDAAGNYDYTGSDCALQGDACAGSVGEILAFVNGLQDTLNGGAWPAAPAPPSIAAHEFGHYAGLPDDYDYRTGNPNAGHAGHMMAGRGNDPVDQHEIDDMLQHHGHAPPAPPRRPAPPPRPPGRGPV